MTAHMVTPLSSVIHIRHSVDVQNLPPRFERLAGGHNELRAGFIGPRHLDALLDEVFGP
jgi:hypothetical protein